MVAFDRPAVEAKAHSLVVSIAADRKQLAVLEDQVLSLLAKQSLVPIAEAPAPPSTKQYKSPALMRKFPSQNTDTPASASALHAILDDQHLINTLQVSSGSMVFAAPSHCLLLLPT